MPLEEEDLNELCCLSDASECENKAVQNIQFTYRQRRTYTSGGRQQRYSEEFPSVHETSDRSCLHIVSLAGNLTICFPGQGACDTMLMLV